jgi:parallel beta-helix repeat protein
MGIAIYSANKNSLWYNTCVSSTDEGIRLDNSNENVIAYNNCSESIRNSGLLMTSPSTNNTIMYNTFYKNKYYGINITDASSQNIIHHNSFFQNNGAGRGVNGNSQAYDSVGGNIWYDVSANEGNYWSNWDGNGNGTANAYPIDGGAGAYDMYPLGNPTPELSPIAVIVVAIALLGIVARRFSICRH